MLLWGLIVVVAASVFLFDTYDSTEGPRRYELGDSAESFFFGRFSGDGPEYSLTINLADGTSRTFRFPLLSDTDVTVLHEKLNRLLVSNDAPPTYEELDAFVQKVISKNQETRAATHGSEQLLIEYRRKRNIEQQQQRKQYSINAVLALVLPPIAVGLLGYGVVRLRRRMDSSR